MSGPLQADELALHDRILQRDPVAPDDVFAIYMPLLFEELMRTKKCRCEEDAYDSAIDAVYSYLDKPERYDPSRSRLAIFLTSIAQRRAVDRYRSRAASDLRDQGFASIVDLQAPSPNEQLERGVEAARMLKRIEESDLSVRDKAVLRLIFLGERDTRVLARVLGVDSLPEDELRREVKRNRDRLMKWLERLGKEDSDDES